MLVVLGAVPVCAQHGSAHGGSAGHGSSGHSAPAFHGGGFSASAPRRSQGAPAYSGSRPSTAARGYRAPASGAWRGRTPYAGSYTGAGRYRRPYVSVYAPGYAYGPGWIAPNYLGYSDDTGSDDSSSPDSAAPDSLAPPNTAPDANMVQDGSDQQPPDDQALPPWPYGGAAQPSPAQQFTAPASAAEEAVTVVFKDGRPPQQIRNYILTRDTLYLNDHHPDIPVDQIDLAATVKVNREAGVDFHLPGDSR